MAKKRQPRNEFRRNNNKDGRSHPAYIYEKVGNEYRFIGITHAPITKGIKNIPLEDNPNPNDDSQSYARPKAEKAHQASFGKKLKGWRLSDKNKKIINQIKK